MNNIFVGNLSFQATKEDVIKLFEPFGTVASAVIMERKKGKSRGYGFVDMPNEDQKNAAILALQGKEFMWRVLSVSPVIPKVKGEESKKFKPAKRELRPESPRRDGRTAKPEPSKEAKSKYYSKFDGPPKPWQKKKNNSKPFVKKDEGSRPYYGKKKESSNFYEKDDRPFKPSSKPPYKKYVKPDFKKKEEGSKYSNKPKITKGFKMMHKVSGATKRQPENK